MIHIYTGDGKGKTTAALGLAIRATGAGLKTAIIYFDKGGAHYSERKLLKKIGIDFFASGLDRVDKKTGRFRFGVITEDKKEARRGLAAAGKLLKSGKYDLVILDEINPAVNLKMLTLEEVLAVIKGKPRATELVLTGRNAPKEFLELADLRTEMKLVKHYFYKGIRARRGIDY